MFRPLRLGAGGRTRRERGIGAAAEMGGLCLSIGQGVGGAAGGVAAHGAAVPHPRGVGAGAASAGDDA
eukprot:1181754-Prorocentrum_minimum.AAC.9